MKLKSYMRLKTKLLLSVVLCASIFANTAHAMLAPDAVVQQAFNEMVNEIQTNRGVYEQDPEALYNLVERVLVPKIHVKRMANLILGKKGQGIDSEKKEIFAKEFKEFLIHSYAKALLSYTGNEKVIYEPVELKPGQDIVKVMAQFIANNGQIFPIVVYMSNRRDKSWRAFNIDIAGINFVRTYRTTFGGLLEKNGIDGLIQELKAKNAKFRR